MLEAEAEGYYCYVTGDAVVENAAAKVEVGVEGIGVVEGLMTRILGLAILVCHVEVYRLVELNTHARSDV